MRPKAYTVGAMMFDEQFKRAEQLESKAIADGNRLLDKAGESMKGVKAVLAMNGLLTIGSTIALVRAARRGGRRG